MLAYGRPNDMPRAAPQPTPRLIPTTSVSFSLGDTGWRCLHVAAHNDALTAMQTIFQSRVVQRWDLVSNASSCLYSHDAQLTQKAP